MSRQVCTTVYQFDELSEKAKEKARDWYREGRGPEDFECVIEDAETILGLLGVSLRYHGTKLMNGSTRQDPNIWWSVGYCQSDGACFEGVYTYAKGAHTAIRKHAPEDQELHRIADTLLEIQKRYRYSLRVEVTQLHSGFYPEVHTTVEKGPLVEPPKEDYDTAKELMRDLCKWIYNQLRTEDEYRRADEQVDEEIRANEYEFLENGARA